MSKMGLWKEKNNARQTGIEKVRDIKKTKGCGLDRQDEQQIMKATNLCYPMPKCGEMLDIPFQTSRHYCNVGNQISSNSSILMLPPEVDIQTIFPLA